MGTCCGKQDWLRKYVVKLSEPLGLMFFRVRGGQKHGQDHGILYTELTCKHLNGCGQSNQRLGGRPFEEVEVEEGREHSSCSSETPTQRWSRSVDAPKFGKTYSQAGDECWRV